MVEKSYRRSERVNDVVHAEVAQILLRKVKDPRIGFVTVTGASVSEDLKHARIYVTIPGGADEKKVLAGLAQACGYIRGLLARRLKTRYTPEVTFVIDRGLKQGDQVLDLLADLEKERRMREDR